MIFMFVDCVCFGMLYKFVFICLFRLVFCLIVWLGMMWSWMWMKEKLFELLWVIEVGWEWILMFLVLNSLFVCILLKMVFRRLVLLILILLSGENFMMVWGMF